MIRPSTLKRRFGFRRLVNLLCNSIIDPKEMKALPAFLHEKKFDTTVGSTIRIFIEHFALKIEREMLELIHEDRYKLSEFCKPCIYNRPNYRYCYYAITQTGTKIKCKYKKTYDEVHHSTRCRCSTLPIEEGNKK